MELLIAIIEHLSWPIVIIVFFLLLRKELSRLLSRVKGIKASDLELQFAEQIQVQGLSKEQLADVSSLTADEIELFLLVSFTEHQGFNYQTGLPPEVFKSKMEHLQKAGLIDLVNPDDPGVNLRHNITPLGNRVRAILINSSAQLVRGI